MVALLFFYEDFYEKYGKYGINGRHWIASQ